MHSCPKCNLVETASLNGAGETEVLPYTSGSDVETTAEKGQSE